MQGKEIKCIHNGKEKNKNIPIHRWYDFIVENSKESNKQLLELGIVFRIEDCKIQDQYTKINCVTIY